MKIIYKCIDCGKELKYKTERCRDCYKKRLENPKNHPNYKGDKAKYRQVYYCISDCDNIVKGENRRCRNCFQSGTNNPMFGKFNINNPNYKPKNHINRYCKICNKIISKGSRLGFCNSCRKRKGTNNPFYGKSHNKETRKKLSLSHGGTGIPYENNKYGIEFNSELKSQVRKRDNYTCQLCYITEEEHLKKYKKSLHIHHKDHNKKNNKSSNLIALCISCHIKTHNAEKKYYEAHKNKD